MADAAADELSEWELSAMSDPRNWVRPAAAVVVGGMAAGGLVLVRARQRHKRQGSGLKALERSLRDVADDLEKRLRSWQRVVVGPARVPVVAVVAAPTQPRGAACLGGAVPGVAGPRPRRPGRSAGAGGCPRCSPGSG